MFISDLDGLIGLYNKTANSVTIIDTYRIDRLISLGLLSTDNKVRVVDMSDKGDTPKYKLNGFGEQFVKIATR